MGFFDIFKKQGEDVEIGEEYVELEADLDKRPKSKVLVKNFLLTEFDDLKPVLEAIREGYTISIVNIQPLKEKDMLTLKRAVDKLKKTVEANDGDIAGLAENLLIVTPSFARIHRGGKEETKPGENPEKTEPVSEVGE